MILVCRFLLSHPSLSNTNLHHGHQRYTWRIFIHTYLTAVLYDFHDPLPTPTRSRMPSKWSTAYLLSPSHCFISYLFCLLFFGKTIPVIDTIVWLLCPDSPWLLVYIGGSSCSVSFSFSLCTYCTVLPGFDSCIFFGLAWHLSRLEEITVPRYLVCVISSIWDPLSFLLLLCLKLLFVSYLSLCR